MKKILFTFLSCLVLGFTLQAQTMVTFSGDAFEIPNPPGNGTFTSPNVTNTLPTCPDGSSILFAGSPLTIVADANFPVMITIDGLTHTWTGDLEIDVTGAVACNLVDNTGGNTDYNGETVTFATGGAPIGGFTGGATGPFAPNGCPDLEAAFNGVDIAGSGFGLQFTDTVGGDGGGIAGWSISFFVDDAEIAAAEAACPMPLACTLAADPVTVALEAGECAEAAFFDLVSPDCEICNSVAAIIPAGVLDGMSHGIDETFGPDGSLVAVNVGDSSDGNPLSYTITLPSAGTFQADVEIGGSTFWDPFEITLDGNVLLTNAAGAICEPVVAGSTFAVEFGTPFFGDAVEDGPVEITGLSLTEFNYPCLEVTQIGGPESGDFLAPGSYVSTFEYTVTSADPVDPCGSIVADPEIAEVMIEILDYDGPVSEALACNDHVNISLDENCEVLLGADIFLEGGPYACYDDYEVSILAFGGGDPIVIDPTTPVALPCGDHTAMVTSPLGNTCWGTFTIEDKIAPEFTVGNIEVTCVEDIPVILANGVTPSSVQAATNLQIAAGGEDVVFEVDLTDSPCATVTDLNIVLDLDYTDGEFAWNIELIAPSGTTYAPAGGLSGCGGLDVILDDDGASPIITCADGNNGGNWNFSAQFGAFEDLANVEGEALQGVWTVVFSYTGATDVTYNDIALIFNEGDTSCDTSPAFPVPNASECECQSYSFSDISNPSDCGDGTVTRTWVCTDKAGNTSDPVVQTITVTPLSLGQLGDTWFVPPALIELPCGTGTDPYDIAAFFDDPSTEDCVDDSDCPEDIIEFNEGIPFAFPYYAAWGCNSSCNSKNEEHFQPIDNNVCNLFVSYSDQDIAACGADCAGNVKVIRTWTVLDWCTSETIPYVQIIKSTDNENPEITAPNITLSVNPWGCVASGPLPAPEHLFDACAKDLTYTVSGPAGVSIISVGDGYALIGAPKGEHTFTYTAEDCCGNVGSSTMTVTVVDDTPPTAIAKENIVISLTSGGFDEGGTAALYTESVDNGSHDGDCGPVRVEIRRVEAPDCGNIGINGYNNNNTFNNNGDPEDNNNDTDGGQWVKFCCEDLEGGDTYEGPNGQIVTFVEDITVVMRVWDDGNCDGIAGGPDVDGVSDNYNETWANVRVENKLPPVIVCPPDASIGCNMDWSLHLDGAAAPTEQELAMLTAPDFGTGIATGAGVCGAVSITYSDRYNEDICYDRNNEITREWCIEGTDICCDQRIDIVKVGAFDPATISWNSGFPEEEIFEDCLFDYTLQEPTWTEAPCDLIAWTVSTDTFYIEGNAAAFGCIKVINDYTVVDWCADEEYTFTQVIKVIDEEAPTLVVPELCVPVVDGCDASVTLCATADDMGDCESPWLKWEVLVDLYGDWSYDHVFSTYVSPLDPNFGTGVNEYYIPASAPGEEVCITLPGGNVPSSKYDHRAIWKVSDGCGNFTSVTETFQVVDKKAPTPYCLSVSSALMTDGSVELWACDFVTGGEDNCTPIDWMRYTFTGPTADGGFPDVVLGDTNCEARTFTCDDISSTSNVVMVDVYSWDECDNYAVCSVELTLTPEGCDFGDDEGSSRIAGAVGTESGDVLGDVSVSIVSNQPEYPMSISTDSNGEFASDNHENTRDYSVSAYSNDDPRNGVSTLDILLIQRHILNLQSLTSPYQYIAADANSDGAITAADLVDIRKLVLEIYDEFPSNTSWRFVDAAQALTTSNAFAFNEVIDILALNADMMNENFIATKTGDVNNSVVLSATGNDTEVRNGNLNMNLTGVSTADGVSVEVTSANFRAIAGYQFTLNTNGMELVSVDAGAINMTDDNVAVLDANTVTMSWNTTSPVTVTDEVLFTLNFAGTDASVVADMDITSEVTTAEAYDADLSVLNVVLGENAEAAFALEQNEPNPFSTQTTVEFSLPTAGTATLTVMDVTGKMVKQITGTYAKGVNSIVLTKAELATSGVLYYQLESGDFSATKKMIIIE